MRNQKLGSFIPYLIVTLAVVSLIFMNFDTTTKKLTYAEYVTLLEQNKVTETNVTVSTVVIKLSGKVKDGTTEYDYTLVIPNTEAQNNGLMDKINASTTTVKIIDAYATNPYVDFFINFVPLLLMGGLFFFFITRMQGGNNNKAFDFGKSKAKLEGEP